MGLKRKGVNPNSATAAWFVARRESLRRSVNRLRERFEEYQQIYIWNHYNVILPGTVTDKPTGIPKKMVKQQAFATLLGEVLAVFDPKGTVDFVEPTEAEKADGVKQVARLCVRSSEIRQPRQRRRKNNKTASLT